MSALACTYGCEDGIVGYGRNARLCGKCEDGYVLCVRCGHDRAQEEFHLEGEGHVCESCYGRYLSRRALATLSDAELEFLEYSPREIRNLRDALAHGFSDADAVGMALANHDEEEAEEATRAA